MKFGDICAIINKNGFSIVNLKDKEELNETYYYDADDFYEQPYAKSYMEREVVWIETNDKGKLRICIM